MQNLFVQYFTAAIKTLYNSWNGPFNISYGTSHQLQGDGGILHGSPLSLYFCVISTSIK